MNIHLAGIEADFNRAEGYVNTGHKNYLTTFARFSRTKNEEVSIRQVKQCYEAYPNCNVILDSGAFSRLNGVVDFSLEDYINFLHRSKNYFYKYITFDYPLRPNASQEEIEFSFINTHKNLEILEKEGLKPLPVYQRAWNKLYRLEEYLEKYDYICIGGAGGFISTKDVQEEIELYFNQVFELNSKYNRKLHGLAQTKLEVLKRFPFYSVDSTSWKMTSAMGNIITFKNLFDKMESYWLGKESFEKNIFSKSLYDYDNKSGHMFRSIFNVEFFNDMERNLTELWSDRGIQWN